MKIAADIHSVDDKLTSGVRIEPATCSGLNPTRLFSPATLHLRQPAGPTVSRKTSVLSQNHILKNASNDASWPSVVILTGIFTTGKLHYLLHKSAIKIDRIFGKTIYVKRAKRYKIDNHISKLDQPKAEPSLVLLQNS